MYTQFRNDHFPLEFQVQDEANNHTNYEETETMVILATQLRTNEIYVAVYINWLYLIVMYIVPFGILVVLNYR